MDDALASLSAAGLRGWTPVRLWGEGPGSTVEWAVVDGPFAEPFFEQTAERAMRRPFNLIFARRTPLAVLDAQDPCEAARPAGLVFHLSRSGSTLIAQMLAALDGSAVVSEAQPLEALLAPERVAVAGHDATVARLRALAGAFPRPRRGEGRLFLKLHARHVLDLPQFARAFPGVPWVFAFREPRAVLRSQAEQPGAEVVAGAGPDLIGPGGSAVAAAGPADHAARTLAAFAWAAVEGALLGGGTFVDYAALPAAVEERVLPHFGIAPTAAERERMRAAAERDTKRGGAPYRLRPAEPARPDAALDALAAQWLDGPHTALRALAAG